MQKPKLTKPIIALLLALFVLFYFFYFVWYSLWYYPPGNNFNAFPPAQPASGPGGRDYKTQEVLIKKITKSNNIVYIFIPQGIDLNSSPIILFLHGLSAFFETDYTIYYSLIAHEVKRGNIVIFPIYQKDFFHPFSPKKFPEIAKSLTKQALLEIKKIAPENDLSQFIIMGSSMGGSVAINIISEDLPAPRALILLTPGETFPFVPTSIYGLPFKELKNLEPNCWLIVLFAGSDHLILKENIKKKIIQRTEGIKNRHIFLIPSDTHGNLPLWSNHLSPFFIPSALDYYGYWKIIDATIDCALFHKNCEIVKGETEETFYMGQWSDGKEVNKIKKIY